MIPFETIARPIIENLISKCTLLTFDYSETKMRPHGCVLYLKSQDNHYLISAAHVFDAFQNRFGIQLNEKGIIPRGRLFLSQNKYMTVEERAKDKVDIGIIRLDTTAAQKISEIYTHQMSLDDIEVSAPPPTTGEGYFLFGFPATNKHVDVKLKTGSIFTEPLIYHTNKATIDYSSIGFNPNEHILLNNDTHEVHRFNDKEAPTVKNLEGISGCGLWKAGSKVINGITEPYARLVGIVNFNYIDRKNNFIVATKIDFITEILRRHFDENIPATTTLLKDNFCAAFAGFN